MALLPYFEQGALYDQFRQEWATGPHMGIGTASSGLLAGGSDPAVNTNLNLSKTKLQMLLCPSDGGPQVYAPADTNYGCGVTESARTSYGFSVSNGNGGARWAAISTDTRAMFGLNSFADMGDIRDGTSNTAAVVETTLDVDDGETQSWACSSHVGQGINLGAPRGINNFSCCDWRTPPNASSQPGRNGSWGEPGSLHTGGIHVLLADGAVRFVSETIDATTRVRLSRISDGQPLGEF